MDFYYPPGRSAKNLTRPSVARIGKRWHPLAPHEHTGGTTKRGAENAASPRLLHRQQAGP